MDYINQLHPLRTELLIQKLKEDDSFKLGYCNWIQEWLGPKNLPSSEALRFLEQILELSEKYPHAFAEIYGPATEAKDISSINILGAYNSNFSQIEWNSYYQNYLDKLRSEVPKELLESLAQDGGSLDILTARTHFCFLEYQDLVKSKQNSLKKFFASKTVRELACSIVFRHLHHRRQIQIWNSPGSGTLILQELKRIRDNPSAMLAWQIPVPTSFLDSILRSLIPDPATLKKNKKIFPDRSEKAKIENNISAGTYEFVPFRHKLDWLMAAYAAKDCKLRDSSPFSFRRFCSYFIKNSSGVAIINQQKYHGFLCEIPVVGENKNFLCLESFSHLTKYSVLTSERQTENFLLLYLKARKEFYQHLQSEILIGYTPSLDNFSCFLNFKYTQTWPSLTPITESNFGLSDPNIACLLGEAPEALAEEACPSFGRSPVLLPFAAGVELRVLGLDKIL